MEMNKLTKYYLILFTLGFTIFSCSQKPEKNNPNMESPLATVVKLESAEAIRDYDAARKLIDVEKVYSKIARESNKTPESVWKEFVEFNSSIGNSSPKFTTSFPFHKYKITELNKKTCSEVKLTSLEDGQSIREIIYKLELKDGAWIVTCVEYIKK